MSDPVVVVGEVGKELRFYPNPTPAPITPIDLTGATVTLHLVAPDNTEQILSCVVDGSGTFATRTTLSTDFIHDGLYQYQLWALFIGGKLLKSMPGTLYVSPSV